MPASTAEALGARFATSSMPRQSVPSKADEQATAASRRPPPIIRVLRKSGPMSYESVAENDLYAPPAYELTERAPRGVKTSHDFSAASLSTSSSPKCESVDSCTERPTLGSGVPSLSTLLRQQFTLSDGWHPTPTVVAAASRLPPLSHSAHRTTPSSNEAAQGTTRAPTALVLDKEDPADSAFLLLYKALVDLPVPTTLDTTFVLSAASEASPTKKGTDEDDATAVGVHEVWTSLSDVPSPKVTTDSNGELALSACGFFQHARVADAFSLLELYRIRCWQLGVKRPDPRVEAQLPSTAGRHSAADVPSIDLSATYVGSVGCLALAAVLPFCTGLRTLTLSGVGLVENSLPVYALLHACRCCRELLFLDLSFNRLGDAAGRWLLQLCHSLPHLRVVWVEQTVMSEMLRRKLQRRLEARDADRITESGIGAGPSASLVSPQAVGSSLRHTPRRPSFAATPPHISTWPRVTSATASRCSPRSQTSSWRTTPRQQRVGSPSPSNLSARTRLSYATPVRSPSPGKEAEHAIGYELLGSAGSLSRLGRSPQSSVRTTYMHTPTPPQVVGLTLFPPVQPDVDAVTSTATEDRVEHTNEDATADPAEVAAWIRDQRAKNKIAASLLHATTEELYDHVRQEDLDHASSCRVPDFVAHALVELRHRLVRNSHAMQRIYDCFLLPEEFEEQIKMGKAGMTGTEEVARLTRRRTRTDRKRKQRDILRSAATQQGKTEALVHMELLQSDDVSEALVTQLQHGTCSWKAFFRGLRILSIDSAASELQQAIRFASVCGILTSEHVCFGKLLNLLRVHVKYERPTTTTIATATTPAAGAVPLRDSASSMDELLRGGLSPRSRLTSEGEERPLSGKGFVGVPSASERLVLSAQMENSVSASRALRARVITWDATPERPNTLPPLLTEPFDAVPLTFDDDPAPYTTNLNGQAEDASSATTACVQTGGAATTARQVVMDKLYDARTALRHAMAALTLDPNHYSTLLFQTTRSTEFGQQQHESMRSDDWIILEREPAFPDAPSSAPLVSPNARVSLCQWPQSQIVQRNVDTAVDQWRRSSLQRASLQCTDGMPDLRTSTNANSLRGASPGERSPNADLVRLSLTDTFSRVLPLSPFSTQLPVVPRNGLACPRRLSEVAPVTTTMTTAASAPPGTGTASVLVPYSSVLRACLAAIGDSHADTLRLVLSLCFTGIGLDAVVADDDDEALAALLLADTDDRLVDVEKDLLQCLKLPPVPAAPPADDERAEWRSINVAELQRLIEAC